MLRLQSAMVITFYCIDIVNALFTGCFHYVTTLAMKDWINVLHCIVPFLANEARGLPLTYVYKRDFCPCKFQAC